MKKQTRFSLKNKKVLVTGSNGMLARNICARLLLADANVYGISRRQEGNLLGVSHIAVDLTDLRSLGLTLKRIEPDIIIQCAANVNVDGCEGNRESTRILHVESTRTLAGFNPKKTNLIYISTDSVFDGEKGNYSETDSPNPLNYYAQTKYEGELAAQSENPSALILRTCIYGFHEPRGSSLAEWALSRLEGGLELPGFTDTFFTPLYVGQVSSAIMKFIQKETQGIIHAGSNESVSKYDFLSMIASVFGYETPLLKPVRIEDLKFTAPRPKNTSLNSNKMQTLFKSSAQCWPSASKVMT